MKKALAKQSRYALGHSEQELERLSRQAEIFEPSQPTADREVKCLSCGGSLRGRHGMFVLKYFMVERSRRVRQKAAVMKAS